MRPWTVLSHDPIEKLEPNLWAVQGALPRTQVRRRMCIVRLRDGRLLFLNAIPLRDEAMRDIEAFGTPAFLLVPNGLHRLDIAAFKERYPALRVLTGNRARRRVAEKVAVDGAWAEVPSDPDVSVIPLDGTKTDEPVVSVRSDGRISLCFFGDAVMNLPHLRGVEGFLLRLIGSTGGPRVTPPARLVMVADRRKLRAHLGRLAGTPGLARIVPCHGAILDRDAPAALREVEARL